MRSSRRVLAVVAATVALMWSTGWSPAVAATPPDHHCSDGEVITHGTFSTVYWSARNCIVSNVSIKLATDDPQDPLFEHGGHLTALKSSIGTVHVDSGEDVTLISSRVSVLSAAEGDVVLNQSYVGRLAGYNASTDVGYPYLYSLIAHDSSIGTGADVEAYWAVDFLDSHMYGALTVYDFVDPGSDGEGAWDYQPVVTLARTRIDGSITLTNPRAVSLCDVHTTGNLTVQTIPNDYPGTYVEVPTVIGGYVDSRSCGAHPTVRVDGSLIINHGTKANPVVLRHVVVGRKLICTSGVIVFEDVTVAGHRVSHC